MSSAGTHKAAPSPASGQLERASDGGSRRVAVPRGGADPECVVPPRHIRLRHRPVHPQLCRRHWPGTGWGGGRLAGGVRRARRGRRILREP